MPTTTRPHAVARALTVAICTVAIITFSAVDARGQITVGIDDLETMLDKQYVANILSSDEPSETDAIDAIVAADGPAQTYDFSGMEFDEEFTGYMTYKGSAESTPGAGVEHYAAADLVMELNFDDGELDTTLTMWTFSQILDDGVYSLGSIMPMGDIDDDGEADTLSIEADPPAFSSPLSYTYGDSWTMENTMGTGDIDVEVNGYGTLIAPDGSERAALRLSYTTEFFGFTTESIEFVTGSDDGSPGVSASIELLPDGNVGSVSFTEIEGEVGTSIADENQEAPARFALESNYPNPFNPATTIPYVVSESEHVTIAVFDVLGREVATLVDEHQAPGRYTVQFEALDLPSGAYIYELTAGSFSQSKSMTLVK